MFYPKGLEIHLDTYSLQGLIGHRKNEISQDFQEQVCEKMANFMGNSREFSGQTSLKKLLNIFKVKNGKFWHFWENDKHYFSSLCNNKSNRNTDYL